ncbi:MAG: SDR family NAD(P)-dependent oxidoreductase [Paracoccaceae bacterium]
MQDFEGQVAIVTGAGNGIGAATARRLAQRGARVVVADIDAEAGGRIAAEIGADRALFVQCDIGDAAAVEAMAATAEAQFGGIDILVNNAAIFRGMGLETPDLPLDAWEKAIHIILTGTFYCCRSVIPRMRQRGRGAIVNVASVSGLGGDNGFSAYNAAKGAVVNYTRTLAIDHGKDGIRVNAVCPGPVVTSRALVTTPEVQAVFLPRIPLRRYGGPEDIASVIAFLASDDAGWMTGAILPVDGGITAHNGQPDLTPFLSQSKAHQTAGG